MSEHQEYTPNVRTLSTGRKVDGDLHYTPCDDGTISVVYGYDQFSPDINDDIHMVCMGQYYPDDPPPFTLAERIELARWQIGLWEEYIRRTAG